MLVSRGQEWPLGSPIVFMGRSENNHVTVSDKSASRVHSCMRISDEGEYYIVDAGSKYGTYVNNEIVIAPRRLMAGDRITIQNQIFQFRGNNDPGVQSLTSFVRSQSEMKNHTPVMLMSAGLYINEVPFFEANERLYAWAFGQWWYRIEQAVEENGGMLDRVLENSILAYWSCEGHNPIDLAQMVKKTAFKCKTITDNLLQEVIGSLEVPPGNPDLFFFGAALHHSRSETVNVGKPDENRDLLTGQEVDITLDLLKEADACPSHVVSTEKFQDTSIGGQGTAPFSMAMAGPRQEPVVIYEIPVQLA